MSATAISRKISQPKALIFQRFPSERKNKVGDKVLLEVSQIGKVCHNRCNIFYTVGDCVMPREGIFAKVIAGGEIKVNDEIEIIE